MSGINEEKLEEVKDEKKKLLREVEGDFKNDQPTEFLTEEE